MALRRRLAPVLAAALLAAACGSDNLTLPQVSRAIIDVAVDPTPVPGSQNPLTGAVSVSFKVAITELNGLGGEVNFVSSQIFDPATGRQVALSYFDGADMVVFVGTRRIEPLGKLTVPQTSTFLLPDFSTAAQLVVNVQVKDDRSNLLNQSVLVKIE